MQTIIREAGSFVLYLDTHVSFVAQKRNDAPARLEYCCWVRDRGAACSVQTAAQNAATIFAKLTGERDVPFALIDANDPFDVEEFERQLRERDYRTRSVPALAVHCNEGGDAE